MKKKLLFLILLFVTFAKIDVYASNFTTSIVGEDNFSNTITLEVKVNKLEDFSSKCGGLCGFVGVLDYDKDKLELTSIKGMNGFELTYGNKIVLYREKGVNTGTNILSLTFKNISLKNNDETTISIKNIVGSDGIKDISSGDISKTIHFLDSSTIQKEFKFKDVKDKDWFYDSVRFAYNNGLVSGFNDYTFGPYDNILRGQFVTILWRLDGEKVYSDVKSQFVDVPNAYYYDAIVWATKNGVVHGYDSKHFGPDDPITREQLVTMLNNFAEFKGLEHDIDYDLSMFKDADKINPQLRKAIMWAAANEIIHGDEVGTARYISPGNSATRAHAAAMVSNFVIKFKLI